MALQIGTHTEVKKPLELRPKSQRWSKNRPHPQRRPGAILRRWGKTAFEIYDYHPGEYKQQPDGDHLVRTRLQEFEVPQQVAYGASDCRAFTSGYRFDLTDYYRLLQERRRLR